MNLKDAKPGMTFGRLTLVKRVRESSFLLWVVQCSCENKTVKEIQIDSLIAGRVKGCGCLREEGLRSGWERKIHGQSKRGKRSKEYKTWNSMKYRCLSKDERYKRYWNIEICDRWKNSFESFFEDMGKAPTSKHTIDRKDNNKGYSPDNCRWATMTEQARNKTNNVIISYNGKIMTAPEWEEETGIPAKDIRRRISRGWSISDALTRPSTKSRAGIKHKPQKRNEKIALPHTLGENVPPLFQEPLEVDSKKEV